MLDCVIASFAPALVLKPGRLLRLLALLGTWLDAIWESQISKRRTILRDTTATYVHSKLSLTFSAPPRAQCRATGPILFLQSSRPNPIHLSAEAASKTLTWPTS
jgi:hypothetical protein